MCTCTDFRDSTFLKRKAGLFKKAHELSVLCSVDVTVLIYGSNNKLYQYCSGEVKECVARHQYVRQPYHPAAKSPMFT